MAKNLNPIYLLKFPFLIAHVELSVEYKTNDNEVRKVTSKRFECGHSIDCVKDFFFKYQKSNNFL